MLVTVAVAVETPCLICKHYTSHVLLMLFGMYDFLSGVFNTEGRIVSAFLSTLPPSLPSSPLP